jgi:hypothetical protein
MVVAAIRRSDDPSASHADPFLRYGGKGKRLGTIHDPANQRHTDADEPGVPPWFEEETLFLLCRRVHHISCTHDGLQTEALS